MEERNTSGPIPWEEPDNREEQDAAHSFEKDANLCPVMAGYYCFNRGCGINHEKQCLMINPKDKIYVDGSKAGDYIQQHIAYRREMEMNYAKMQDELTRLRSELQQKDESIKELCHVLEGITQIHFENGSRPSKRDIERIKSLIEKVKSNILK